MKSLTDKNLISLRKYVKDKIQNETEFVGYLEEYDQVYNLLNQTIKSGESNSALLIGPRSCGKTTLVNNALNCLKKSFESDACLVRLHGLIHTDDRIALKSITSQLNLDNVVEGKVFGNFADNLAFLLACLKSGIKDTSKSIVFIIEEFDLFCSHRNQTLLYNLFDVSQSAQTSICVLGLTCRLDVIELLEKRVKSRFSHRQIFLFTGNQDGSQLKQGIARLQSFLIIPKTRKIGTTLAFEKQWNNHVAKFLENKELKNVIQRLLDLDNSERVLKNILFVVISQLDDENNKLTVEAFQEQTQKFEQDEIVSILLDLSVLEFSLIITMKHHCDIYDNQPMNFEMIYHRFVKFANTSSKMETAERPTVMKAFETIKNLELISIMGGNSSMQKEYQLFSLLVLPEQITEAVKKYSGLPTEIIQYASSSFV